MYFITTKRMLEVCFFQHTPTFIIEPYFCLAAAPFFLIVPLWKNEKFTSCAVLVQGMNAPRPCGA